MATASTRGYAYHYPMKTAASLPPEALSRAFDVATMQFCMHYAFETESAVHQMLDNVAIIAQE